jgi:hypothetical protein
MTTTRLRQLPHLDHLARKVPSWCIGPSVFILSLIVYCELHALVTGKPQAGLAVSGGWAVRIAIGWIVAIAALQHFGRRVASIRLAVDHPWLAASVGIACIATFTLGCEWLLSMSSNRWSSAFSFFYARFPIHLAGSAVLIVVFARGHGSAAQHTNGVTATRKRPAEESIEVMTGTGRTTIRVDDIELLKAERNYVNVMHRSGRTYLLRRTMAALEASLDPQSFVRVHRSIIVNRASIKERRAGGSLVLQSGTTVRVSRAYRDNL